MELGLFIVCGILMFIIILLVVKLYLVRKSVSEIEKSFEEITGNDTNHLIDISSRDRMVRRLANSINEQLRQLRRERRRFQQGDLELKEAVTNISHDLRTPLTAICGYLDLLSKEETTETVTRYLKMIRNRSEVLKQLTEELFHYSVISSVNEGDCEPLVLNSILEESLASYYGALIQKKITPVITIPEQPVERYLSKSSLVRVFGNVISNVLKYSDGDLEVIMDEKGKIVFSNTATNLTPVMAGRLFDRFYTVETGRNSTGLGLSIAKLLTERMGGTITADYQKHKIYIIICF